MLFVFRWCCFSLLLSRLSFLLSHHQHLLFSSLSSLLLPGPRVSESRRTHSDPNGDDRESAQVLVDRDGGACRAGGDDGDHARDRRGRRADAVRGGGAASAGSRLGRRVKVVVGGVRLGRDRVDVVAVNRRVGAAARRGHRPRRRRAARRVDRDRLLRQPDGEDVERAAGVPRGERAEDRVRGVPRDDLARLQGEEGLGRRALDAEVLGELGVGEALGVGSLGGGPGLDGVDLVVVVVVGGG